MQSDGQNTRGETDSAGTDAEILARVVQGDREAYAVVVRRYHRRLFYCLAGRLAADCDTEDIVQRTFVTAYQKAATFDGSTDFFVWLRGIALNHCRDEWKHRQRQAKLKGRVLDLRVAEIGAELVERPPEQTESRVTALQECLGRLPEDERDLVRRRFVQQSPLQELAEAAGRTEEALRRHLYRLRQKLSECVRRRLSVEGRPS